MRREITVNATVRKKEQREKGYEGYEDETGIEKVVNDPTREWIPGEEIKKRGRKKNPDCLHLLLQDRQEIETSSFVFNFDPPQEFAL